MRNVTVSLDDEIYQRARVRAAELGTSLSALVRGYLENLGTDETEAERLRKAERVLRANIVAFSVGERAAGDRDTGNQA